MSSDRVLPRTPAQMRDSFVEDDGLKESDIRHLTRRCERALSNRHVPPSRQTWEWAYLEELIVGERRLDGWAIGRRDNERRAYEIKVTRSDFLSELRTPEKRAVAMSVSNRFFFVAPVGLIQPDELPDGCGLLEVVMAKSVLHDKTRMKVEAPFRDAGDLPLWLVFEIARRAA